MDLVVGTAGHIDHGKTALVKALTGVDADRLPEEKQRGITIDLGFADLKLGGSRISFVDVPGHERFVKNMLAGAGGIDLVMLVIAADEGVMPQTREHFEICRLLGTKSGLVVITKTDLVEEDFLDLVELDAAELVEGSFLENAPVIRSSAKTGEGIDEIREHLKAAAESLPAREDVFSTRLPIDRSFSVKGFGSVVTGTLLSGAVRTGDEMEILPMQRKVRVRGIQTHGDQVDSAEAGRRTAVNLAGIEHEEISRGMVLAEPGAFEPTQIIDARVEVLSSSDKPLRSRQRVRAHIGTAEVLARVDVLNTERFIAPGSAGLIQLRFESPVVTVPSDRFIIRRYSPQITIAGGTVLDSFARKHKRKELGQVTDSLGAIFEGSLSPGLVVRAAAASGGIEGRTFREVRGRTGLSDELLETELENLKEAGEVVSTDNYWISAGEFSNLRRTILDLVTAHHKTDPLSTGMRRETLREKAGGYVPEEVFRRVLTVLEEEGAVASEKDVVRIASHTRDLSPEAKNVLERLSAMYSEAGLEPPSLKESLPEAVRGTSVRTEEARKIFQMLVESSDVLKVTDEFFFSKAAVAELIGKLKSYAETEAENRLITVPEFKDLAGISRKYAIPLLEYFDAVKVTKRAGDKRLVL
ncbi:MAG: selenocysteine-specific translation elongation factor [Acidobacteriota bacterium]|nr:MAG: selenocysteine-specific translation elongation factor [Acidobacteriota bacterium]